MVARQLWTAGIVLFSLAPLSLRCEEKEVPGKAAEEAGQKAAKWLLAQANEDGTFGQSRARGVPGIVGLTLYALANSPGKPAAEKTPAIEKAAAYLAGKQMENGAIAIAGQGNENYNTCVATMALKALNDPKYNEVLEKAKAFILECQHGESDGLSKDNMYHGGFFYGKVKNPDLSNTSFSLEALKALGVKEDSPAFQNALLFVRRCQDNPETNDVAEMKAGDGTWGFLYRPFDSEFGTTTTRAGKEFPTVYGNMTYAAVKCLIFCGIKAESPELQVAWKWIKSNYSVEKNPGGKGTQGYFYYLVAFAKAFTAAGTKELTLADGRKVVWAADLARQISTLQKPDGSFRNEDPRWMEDDAVLSTSYALIALNLCREALK